MMKKDLLRIRGSRKKLTTHRPPRMLKLWTQNLLDNFQIAPAAKASHSKSRTRHSRKSDIENWNTSNKITQKTKLILNRLSKGNFRFQNGRKKLTGSCSKQKRKVHTRTIHSQTGASRQKTKSNKSAQTASRQKNLSLEKSTKTGNYRLISKGIHSIRSRGQSNHSQLTKNCVSTSKCEFKITANSRHTKSRHKIAKKRERSSRNTHRHTYISDNDKQQSFLPYLIAAKYKKLNGPKERELRVSEEMVRVLHQNTNKKSISSECDVSIKENKFSEVKSEQSKIVEIESEIRSGFDTNIILKRFYQNLDDGARLKRKRLAKAKAVKKIIENFQESINRGLKMVQDRKIKNRENQFQVFRYERVRN